MKELILVPKKKNSSDSITKLREVAEEAARNGANYIREEFQGDESITIREKKKGDFVTNIDIRAEKIIRSTIHKYYKTTLIMGEEEGVTGEGKKNIWFIDPLDGTGAFIRGNYAFVSVSVAVADQKTKKVLAGAICNPFTSLMYSAEAGINHANLNSREFLAPIPPKMNKARMLVDFSSRHTVALQIALGTADVTNKVGRLLRYDGSIAQHLCLIAKGALHAGIFWGLGKEKGGFYDIGAALLICQQAGLEITNLEGTEITFDSPFFDQIIVAPEPLHKEILTWVSELRSLEKSSFAKLEKITPADLKDLKL